MPKMCVRQYENKGHRRPKKQTFLRIMESLPETSYRKRWYYRFLAIKRKIKEDKEKRNPRETYSQRMKRLMLSPLPPINFYTFSIGSIGVPGSKPKKEKKSHKTNRIRVQPRNYINCANRVIKAKYTGHDRFKNNVRKQARNKKYNSMKIQSHFCLIAIALQPILLATNILNSGVGFIDAHVRAMVVGVWGGVCEYNDRRFNKGTLGDLLFLSGLKAILDNVQFALFIIFLLILSVVLNIVAILSTALTTLFLFVLFNNVTVLIILNSNGHRLINRVSLLFMQALTPQIGKYLHSITLIYHLIKLSGSVIKGVYRIVKIILLLNIEVLAIIMVNLTNAEPNHLDTTVRVTGGGGKKGKGKGKNSDGKNAQQSIFESIRNSTASLGGSGNIAHFLEMQQNLLTLYNQLASMDLSGDVRRNLSKFVKEGVDRASDIWYRDGLLVDIKPSDGACMWHSISAQIPNMTYLNLIDNFIMSHQMDRSFDLYAEPFFQDNDAQTIREELASGRRWGDDYCIRHICSAINCVICCYDANGRFNIYPENLTRGLEYNKVVIVAWHNGAHFDSFHFVGNADHRASIKNKICNACRSMLGDFTNDHQREFFFGKIDECLNSIRHPDPSRHIESTATSPFEQAAEVGSTATSSGGDNIDFRVTSSMVLLSKVREHKNTIELYIKKVEDLKKVKSGNTKGAQAQVMLSDILSLKGIIEEQREVLINNDFRDDEVLFPDGLDNCDQAITEFIKLASYVEEPDTAGKKGKEVLQSEGSGKGIDSTKTEEEEASQKGTTAVNQPPVIEGSSHKKGSESGDGSSIADIRKKMHELWRKNRGYLGLTPEKQIDETPEGDPKARELYKTQYTEVFKAVMSNEARVLNVDVSDSHYVLTFNKIVDVCFSRQLLAVEDLYGYMVGRIAYRQTFGVQFTDWAASRVRNKSLELYNKIKFNINEIYGTLVTDKDQSINRQTNIQRLKDAIRINKPNDEPASNPSANSDFQRTQLDMQYRAQQAKDKSGSTAEPHRADRSVAFLSDKADDYKDQGDVSGEPKGSGHGVMEGKDLENYKRNLAAAKQKLLYEDIGFKYQFDQYGQDRAIIDDVYSNFPVLQRVTGKTPAGIEVKRDPTISEANDKSKLNVNSQLTTTINIFDDEHDHRYLTDVMDRVASSLSKTDLDIAITRLENEYSRAMKMREDLIRDVTLHQRQYELTLHSPLSDRMTLHENLTTKKCRLQALNRVSEKLNYVKKTFSIRRQNNTEEERRARLKRRIEYDVKEAAIRNTDPYAMALLEEKAKEALIGLTKSGGITDAKKKSLIGMTGISRAKSYVRERMPKKMQEQESYLSKSLNESSILFKSMSLEHKGEKTVSAILRHSVYHKCITTGIVAIINMIKDIQVASTKLGDRKREEFEEMVNSARNGVCDTTVTLKGVNLSDDYATMRHKLGTRVSDLGPLLAALVELVGFDYAKQLLDISLKTQYNIEGVVITCNLLDNNDLMDVKQIEKSYLEAEEKRLTEKADEQLVMAEMDVEVEKAISSIHDNIVSIKTKEMIQQLHDEGAKEEQLDSRDKFSAMSFKFSSAVQQISAGALEKKMKDSFISTFKDKGDTVSDEKMIKMQENVFLSRMKSLEMMMMLKTKLSTSEKGLNSSAALDPKGSLSDNNIYQPSPSMEHFMGEDEEQPWQIILSYFTYQSLIRLRLTCKSKSIMLFKGKSCNNAMLEDLFLSFPLFSLKLITGYDNTLAITDSLYPEDGSEDYYAVDQDDIDSKYVDQIDKIITGGYLSDQHKAKTDIGSVRWADLDDLQDEEVERLISSLNEGKTDPALGKVMLQAIHEADEGADVKEVKLDVLQRESIEPVTHETTNLDNKYFGQQVREYRCAYITVPTLPLYNPKGTRTPIRISRSSFDNILKYYGLKAIPGYPLSVLVQTLAFSYGNLDLMKQAVAQRTEGIADVLNFIWSLSSSSIDESLTSVKTPCYILGRNWNKLRDKAWKLSAKGEKGKYAGSKGKSKGSGRKGKSKKGSLGLEYTTQDDYHYRCRNITIDGMNFCYIEDKQSEHHILRIGDYLLLPPISSKFEYIQITCDPKGAFFTKESIGKSVVIEGRIMLSESLEDKKKTTIIHPLLKAGYSLKEIQTALDFANTDKVSKLIATGGCNPDILAKELKMGSVRKCCSLLTTDDRTLVYACANQICRGKHANWETACYVRFLSIIGYLVLKKDKFSDLFAQMFFKVRHEIFFIELLRDAGIPHEGSDAMVFSLLSKGIKVDPAFWDLTPDLLKLYKNQDDSMTLIIAELGVSKTNADSYYAEKDRKYKALVSHLRVKNPALRVIPLTLIMDLEAPSYIDAVSELSLAVNGQKASVCRNLFFIKELREMTHLIDTSGAGRIFAKDIEQYMDFPVHKEVQDLVDKLNPEDDKLCFIMSYSAENEITILKKNRANLLKLLREASVDNVYCSLNYNYDAGQVNVVTDVESNLVIDEIINSIEDDKYDDVIKHTKRESKVKTKLHEGIKNICLPCTVEDKDNFVENNPFLVTDCSCSQALKEVIDERDVEHYRGTVPVVLNHIEPKFAGCDTDDKLFKFFTKDRDGVDICSGRLMEEFKMFTQEVVDVPNKEVDIESIFIDKLEEARAKQNSFPHVQKAKSTFQMPFLELSVPLHLCLKDGLVPPSSMKYSEPYVGDNTHAFYKKMPNDLKLLLSNRHLGLQLDYFTKSLFDRAMVISEGIEKSKAEDSSTKKLLSEFRSISVSISKNISDMAMQMAQSTDVQKKEWVSFLRGCNHLSGRSKRSKKKVKKILNSVSKQRDSLKKLFEEIKQKKDLWLLGKIRIPNELKGKGRVEMNEKMKDFCIELAKSRKTLTLLRGLLSLDSFSKTNCFIISDIEQKDSAFTHFTQNKRLMDRGQIETMGFVIEVDGIRQPITIQSASSFFKSSELYVTQTTDVRLDYIKTHNRDSSDVPCFDSYKTSVINSMDKFRSRLGDPLWLLIADNVQRFAVALETASTTQFRGHHCYFDNAGLTNFYMLVLGGKPRTAQQNSKMFCLYYKITEEAYDLYYKGVETRCDLTCVKVDHCYHIFTTFMQINNTVLNDMLTVKYSLYHGLDVDTSMLPDDPKFCSYRESVTAFQFLLVMNNRRKLEELLGGMKYFLDSGMGSHSGIHKMSEEFTKFLSKDMLISNLIVCLCHNFPFFFKEISEQRDFLLQSKAKVTCPITGALIHRAECIPISMYCSRVMSRAPIVSDTEALQATNLALKNVAQYYKDNGGFWDKSGLDNLRFNISDRIDNYFSGKIDRKSVYESLNDYGKSVMSFDVGLAKTIGCFCRSYLNSLGAKRAINQVVFNAMKVSIEKAARSSGLRDSQHRNKAAKGYELYYEEFLDRYQAVQEKDIKDPTFTKFQQKLVTKLMRMLEYSLLLEDKEYPLADKTNLERYRRERELVQKDYAQAAKEFLSVVEDRMEYLYGPDGRLMVEKLDEIALFSIAYKLQWAGSRELWVLYSKFRPAQAIVEKVYTEVARHLPNEIISISSKDRPEYIQSELFEGVTQKLSTSSIWFLTIDHSKWGPQSNTQKYILFHTAMADIFDPSFNDIFYTLMYKMEDKRESIALVNLLYSEYKCEVPFDLDDKTNLADIAAAMDTLGISYTGSNSLISYYKWRMANSGGDDRNDIYHEFPNSLSYQAQDDAYLGTLNRSNKSHLAIIRKYERENEAEKRRRWRKKARSVLQNTRVYIPAPPPFMMGIFNLVSSVFIASQQLWEVSFQKRLADKVMITDQIYNALSQAKSLDDLVDSFTSGFLAEDIDNDNNNFMKSMELVPDIEETGKDECGSTDSDSDSNIGFDRDIGPSASNIDNNLSDVSASVEQAELREMRSEPTRTQDISSRSESHKEHPDSKIAKFIEKVKSNRKGITGLCRYLADSGEESKIKSKLNEILKSDDTNNDKKRAITELARQTCELYDTEISKTGGEELFRVRVEDKITSVGNLSDEIKSNLMKLLQKVQATLNMLVQNYAVKQVLIRLGENPPPTLLRSIVATVCPEQFNIDDIDSIGTEQIYITIDEDIINFETRYKVQMLELSNFVMTKCGSYELETFLDSLRIHNARQKRLINDKSTPEDKKSLSESRDIEMALGSIINIDVKPKDIRKRDKSITDFLKAFDSSALELYKQRMIFANIVTEHQDDIISLIIDEIQDSGMETVHKYPSDYESPDFYAKFVRYQKEAIGIYLKSLKVGLEVSDEVAETCDNIRNMLLEKARVYRLTLPVSEESTSTEILVYFFTVSDTVGNLDEQFKAQKEHCLNKLKAVKKNIHQTCGYRKDILLGEIFTDSDSGIRSISKMSLSVLLSIIHDLEFEPSILLGVFEFLKWNREGILDLHCDITPMAHSDDAAKKLIGTDTGNYCHTKLTFRFSDMLNHQISAKKFLISTILMEFLSQFFLIKRTMPVGSKFANKCSFLPSDSHIFGDLINRIASIVIEGFCNGIPMDSLYRSMKIHIAMHLEMYKVTRGKYSTENMTLVHPSLGGIPDCLPLLYVIAGNQADLVRLDMIDDPANSFNHIIALLNDCDIEVTTGYVVPNVVTNEVRSYDKLVAKMQKRLGSFCSDRTRWLVKNSKVNTSLDLACKFIYMSQSKDFSLAATGEDMTHRISRAIKSSTMSTLLLNGMSYDYSSYMEFINEKYAPQDQVTPFTEMLRQSMCELYSFYHYFKSQESTFLLKEGSIGYLPRRPKPQPITINFRAGTKMMDLKVDAATYIAYVYNKNLAKKAKAANDPSMYKNGMIDMFLVEERVMTKRNEFDKITARLEFEFPGWTEMSPNVMLKIIESISTSGNRQIKAVQYLTNYKIKNTTNPNDLVRFLICECHSSYQPNAMRIPVVNLQSYEETIKMQDQYDFLTICWKMRMTFRYPSYQAFLEKEGIEEVRMTGYMKTLHRVLVLNWHHNQDDYKKGKAGKRFTWNPSYPYYYITTTQQRITRLNTWRGIFNCVGYIEGVLFRLTARDGIASLLELDIYNSMSEHQWSELKFFVKQIASSCKIRVERVLTSINPTKPEGNCLYKHLTSFDFEYTEDAPFCYKMIRSANLSDVALELDKCELRTKTIRAYIGSNNIIDWGIIRGKSGPQTASSIVKSANILKEAYEYRKVLFRPDDILKIRCVKNAIDGVLAKTQYSYIRRLWVDLCTQELKEETKFDKSLSKAIESLDNKDRNRVLAQINRYGIANSMKFLIKGGDEKVRKASAELKENLSALSMYPSIKHLFDPVKDEDMDPKISGFLFSGKLDRVTQLIHDLEHYTIPENRMGLFGHLIGQEVYTIQRIVDLKNQISLLRSAIAREEDIDQKKAEDKITQLMNEIAILEQEYYFYGSNPYEPEDYSRGVDTYRPITSISPISRIPENLKTLGKTQYALMGTEVNYEVPFESTFTQALNTDKRTELLVALQLFVCYYYHVDEKINVAMNSCFFIALIKLFGKQAESSPSFLIKLLKGIIKTNPFQYYIDPKTGEQVKQNRGKLFMYLYTQGYRLKDGLIYNDFSLRASRNDITADAVPVENITNFQNYLNLIYAAHKQINLTKITETENMSVANRVKTIQEKGVREHTMTTFSISEEYSEAINNFWVKSSNVLKYSFVEFVLTNMCPNPREEIKSFLNRTGDFVDTKVNLGNIIKFGRLAGQKVQAASKKEGNYRHPNINLYGFMHFMNLDSDGQMRAISAWTEELSQGRSDSNPNNDFELCPGYKQTLILLHRMYPAESFSFKIMKLLESIGSGKIQNESLKGFINTTEKIKIAKSKSTSLKKQSSFNPTYEFPITLNLGDTNLPGFNKTILNTQWEQGYSLVMKRIYGIPVFGFTSGFNLFFDKETMTVNNLVSRVINWDSVKVTTFEFHFKRIFGINYNDICDEHFVIPGVTEFRLNEVCSRTESYEELMLLYIRVGLDSLSELRDIIAPIAQTKLTSVGIILKNASSQDINVYQGVRTNFQGKTRSNLKHKEVKAVDRELGGLLDHLSQGCISITPLTRNSLYKQVCDLKLPFFSQVNPDNIERMKILLMMLINDTVPGNTDDQIFLELFSRYIVRMTDPMYPILDSEEMADFRYLHIPPDLTDKQKNEGTASELNVALAKAAHLLDQAIIQSSNENEYKYRHDEGLRGQIFSEEYINLCDCISSRRIGLIENKQWLTDRGISMEFNQAKESNIEKIKKEVFELELLGVYINTNHGQVKSRRFNYSDALSQFTDALSQIYSQDYESAVSLQGDGSDSSHLCITSSDDDKQSEYFEEEHSEQTDGSLPDDDDLIADDVFEEEYVGEVTDGEVFCLMHDIFSNDLVQSVERSMKEGWDKFIETHRDGFEFYTDIATYGTLLHDDDDCYDEEMPEAGPPTVFYPLGRKN